MRIVFTVTNDLTYDQRMIRICESIANAGFSVSIIGIKMKSSIPVHEKKYFQKRMHLFFKRGFGFYAEYNIRLLLHLLFRKADIICCIDLDTMLPVYFAAFLKRKIKVYDAHEYFSQQKEILTRPVIYKIWHFIERSFLPAFKRGYTVNESIAAELLKHYNVNYAVIKNVPILQIPGQVLPHEEFILYQGSVNEGRGFEFLIPAMKEINSVLHIYGDGNFMDGVRRLIEAHGVGHKVFLKGKTEPGELNEITSRAYVGINLVEPFGLNQYFSLANKFFDYMHHEVPQVTMNFPEYQKINKEYEIALLIDELSVKCIVDAINKLLNDKTLYNRLKQNCLLAREHFNWQIEEQKLIHFYRKLIE